MFITVFVEPSEINTRFSEKFVISIFITHFYLMKLLQVTWNFTFLKRTSINLVQNNCNFDVILLLCRRSQWPPDLRRRSTAARLLRSCVRIPPGQWTFVYCACCVLSGRGLCDELITRSEESYRVWCVVVCDQETSRMRRPWPALGCSATRKRKKNYSYVIKVTRWSVFNFISWSLRTLSF